MSDAKIKELKKRIAVAEKDILWFENANEQCLSKIMTKCSKELKIHYKDEIEENNRFMDELRFYVQSLEYKINAVIEE